MTTVSVVVAGLSAALSVSVVPMFSVMFSATCEANPLLSILIVYMPGARPATR